MPIDKFKQLKAAKTRLAQLQKALAAQLRREFVALPAKYGFDNVADFVRAVSAAHSGRAGGGKGAGKAGRRRRAVITDATRAEVKKLAAAGKTGAEIARAVRISLPSVQNIKKALGLVKARK
jgi:DNA-binding CsgD family transcriptional regulator